MTQIAIKISKQISWQVCSNDLPYYRVEGKNEHRGSTQVSWTRLVKVFVYGEELELVKDHPYEAKVSITTVLQ